MPFELFYQLLYIRSAHNDEADFLKKLEHMTPEEVRTCYENLCINSTGSTSKKDCPAGQSL